jgi:hypothetical protein
VKTKLPGGVLCHQHEGQRSDNPEYQEGNPYEASDVPLGAGDSRADIAELQRAKAAGEVTMTEFEIRQAESKQLQSPSTLTREQVHQEVAALRDQGLLNIHGDH